MENKPCGQNTSRFKILQLDLVDIQNRVVETKTLFTREVTLLYREITCVFFKEM
jgi:hypothetical protein